MKLIRNLASFAGHWKCPVIIISIENVHRASGWLTTAMFKAGHELDP
jgi:hypothetical protein